MDASSQFNPPPLRSGLPSGQPEASDIVVFGPFRLDNRRRVLTAHGHEVALQPRAFDLLALFVACRGQVLSNDEIVGHIWRGIAVGDNNLGVQLSALRRVLADHGGKGLIVTVPHRGYRFIGEAEAEPGSAERPPDVPQALPSAPNHRQGPRRLRSGLAVGAALALILCLIGAGWRFSWPAARPPAAALAEPINPPPNSIAVLAFANMSNDPAQDYLSDGLSEAVIDSLSRVDELQVTARTSSFYFKDKAATIDEIGRRLHVAAVLEGSLRRQGTHLRIDTHLSDARTGYQLWSQSYDVEMADMLKLQDEIAGAAAEALQTRLLDKGASGHSLGGTSNPLAFDAYLRGEKHLRAVHGELEPALQEFRNAVALDPNFALAQSSLAVVLAYINNESDVYDDAFRDRMAEAQRIAERAVALAPGLGIAHARLAEVLGYGVTDLNAAWIEANRARALSPGDASVQGQFALTASLVGRHQAAIAAGNRAVELDPLRPDSWYALGQALDCARKFDAAISAMQTGIVTLGHPTTALQAEIGSLLVEEGKGEAARKYCTAMPEWGGGCLLLANHLLGRQAEVDAKLAQDRARKNGDVWAYNNAGIYAQLNQPVLAMRWLEKARQLHDPALQVIECDTNVDPIRNQPGFREIEQSLHFPPPD